MRKSTFLLPVLVIALVAVLSAVFIVDEREKALVLQFGRVVTVKEDPGLAFKLAGMGVRTMEDLAEQSVDDLLDIEGMDEERAGQLIMAARAPWFEDQA